MQVAILEAASTGLPIIATNAGGSKDFVNSNNGRLVPERNAQALADAIVELANDPEERRFLGIQARADIVAKFDYRRSQRPLVKIFKELHNKYKS